MYLYNITKQNTFKIPSKLTKEMLATGHAIKHYAHLYNCKFFRNRVLRLQALCHKLNLDAILLVNGK